MQLDTQRKLIQIINYYDNKLSSDDKKELEEIEKYF